MTACLTRSWLRRQWTLAVVLLLLAATAASVASTLAAGADRDEQAARPTVRLVIDYGDGCEKHFTQLDWHDGMVVLDALRAAQKHPRGIRIRHRGRGPTAFLQQIDDLKNQGAGGPNWVFSIDGELSGRGMGVARIRPDQRITWTFGHEQPRPE